jgi:hypothetical protein
MLLISRQEPVISNPAVAVLLFTTGVLDRAGVEFATSSVASLLTIAGTAPITAFPVIRNRSVP